MHSCFKKQKNVIRSTIPKGGDLIENDNSKTFMWPLAGIQ